MSKLFSHDKRCAWALLVVFGAMLVPAYGQVSLPYYESFESGVGDWEKSTAAASDPTTTSLEAIVGSYALNVRGTGAKVDVNGSPTNVIAHLITKAEPSTVLPSIDSDAAAAVVVYDDGSGLAIWLQDESQDDDWLETTTVTEDSWLAIAVHLDYSTDTYNAYYAAATADGGVEGSMTLLNTNGPIAFPATYGGSALSSIVVTQEVSDANGLIDTVGLTVPLKAVDSGFDMLNVNLRRTDVEQHIGLPPYNYAPADWKMDGALGDDLAVGLSNGDDIDVVVDGTGWVSFNYVSGSGTWSPDVGAVGDYTLTNTVGMILKRGAGSDTLAMYPFNSTASPASVQGTMYANDNGTFGGKTRACLPADYPNCVGINSVAFNLLAWDSRTGDYILFYDEDTGTYERYLSNGTEWVDVNNATATREICPGETFIYHRRHISGGTARTWTLMY